MGKILRDGTAVDIAGPSSGVAYNMQGNKSGALQKDHAKLYVKLNPASAKKWFEGRAKHWPQECTAVECLELKRSGRRGTARDGAHVMLDSPASNDVYIIPTCRMCNVNVIEFRYEGVAPLMLVRLTDSERTIIETCKNTPKKRTKAGRAKDFVVRKINVGGARVQRAAASTYEKGKAALTRKKKHTAHDAPSRDERGETDDVDTTIHQKATTPEKTCGSTDTVDEKPCKNSINCSIDHAKMREDRERKKARRKGGKK
jgi:hypothetical protein